MTKTYTKKTILFEEDRVSESNQDLEYFVGKCITGRATPSELKTLEVLLMMRWPINNGSINTNTKGLHEDGKI